MKLKESHIVDYLDDKLRGSDCDTIELQLEQDDSSLGAVDDARLAMQVLHTLASEETVAVSADFWPRLREKLPESPPRNPLSRLFAEVASWTQPSSAKWAISVPVALLIAFLAAVSLWMGPQRTVTPSSAVTASEKAFISRSMQRHQDYVNTPPSINSLPLPMGDASSADQNAVVPSDDVYMP